MQLRSGYAWRFTTSRWLRNIPRAPAQAGQVLHLHAKFDTGMGRLGHNPVDGVEFVRWLGEQPALRLEGVFTHLAVADEPENPVTLKHLSTFDALLAGAQQPGCALILSTLPTRRAHCIFQGRATTWCALELQFTGCNQVRRPRCRRIFDRR